MTELEFIRRTEEIKKRLYRTALLYLGSETMALDAVDEAVYKGFCSYKKLREEDFFETWMTRILINVCNSELRRRKKEVTIAQLPEQAEVELDALPLKEAVSRLPQELRAVIILRFFTGLTLAQTAQTLNIPQGTVSTRQRKALQLLKLELTEKEGMT